jgi:hypothetical protein
MGGFRERTTSNYPIIQLSRFDSTCSANPTWMFLLADIFKNSTFVDFSRRIGRRMQSTGFWQIAYMVCEIQKQVQILRGHRSLASVFTRFCITWLYYYYRVSCHFCMPAVVRMLTVHCKTRIEETCISFDSHQLPVDPSRIMMLDSVCLCFMLFFMKECTQCRVYTSPNRRIKRYIQRCICFPQVNFLTSQKIVACVLQLVSLLMCSRPMGQIVRFSDRAVIAWTRPSLVFETAFALTSSSAERDLEPRKSL